MLNKGIFFTVSFVLVYFLINKNNNKEEKYEIMSNCNQYYEYKNMSFEINCFDNKCYNEQKDINKIQILSNDMIKNNFNHFKKDMNEMIDKIQKEKRQKLIENSEQYIETSLNKLNNEFNNRICDLQNKLFEELKKKNIEPYKDFWNDAKHSQLCYNQIISLNVNEILGDEFKKYELFPNDPYNTKIKDKFKAFLKNANYDFEELYQWNQYHIEIKTNICDNF